MLIAFQTRGDEMQRDTKGALWVSCAAFGVFYALAGSAFAQSVPEPVADFAALIGVPMTAADVVSSRSGSSTPQDVQRRIEAAGVRRSAADRMASEGLNRALARMPETAEMALRQAAEDTNGAGLVRTSRQEIEPIFAVPSRGGGTKASHGVNEKIAR